MLRTYSAENFKFSGKYQLHILCYSCGIFLRLTFLHLEAKKLTTDFSARLKLQLRVELARKNSDCKLPPTAIVASSKHERVYVNRLARCVFSVDRLISVEIIW